METFRYSLRDNHPKRSKTLEMLFIIIGIINIILGLVYLFFKFDKYEMGYMYSFEGIGYTVMGLVSKHSIDKYFIQFNSDKISASHKKLNIHWENIADVHIAPIKIDFHLSDGSQTYLPLDSLGYNDVQLIKSKFLEFAEYKEITVN